MATKVQVAFGTLVYRNGHLGRFARLLTIVHSLDYCGGPVFKDLTGCKFSFIRLPPMPTRTARNEFWVAAARVQKNAM